jgi:exodeoxyribonuclease VII large subunit
VEADFTWTVAQVNEYAAAAVTAAFPDLIWVEGEICNLNRSARGHVYFNLIEPGADRRSPDTQLSVTLFEWNKQKVNLQIRRSGGNIRMEDGIKVRIRGTLELYQARGQIQLKMIAIDPAYTLGNLAADRAALLARLASAGLLDANARRPLVALPLHIALVTSLGSAAHADFLHELEASGVGFHLREVDARVQGVEAELTVAAAVAAADAADVDLVCIVRGGGARTDLAAFDHERIARAVAQCRAPVWVGIGHEIDRTVTDDVAHTSFKTPTACAAAVVERVRAGEAAVEEQFAAVVRRADVLVTRGSAAVERRAHDVARATRSGIERGARQLEVAATRVTTRSHRLLDGAQARVEGARASAATVPARHLRSAERDLEAWEARVRAYDPVRVMERGWSMTRRADGTLVRSVADIEPGSELVTRLADGEARSTVESVEDHPRV